MGQSLADAAVRGVSGIVLSPEQCHLLTDGDIEGLLEFHRSAFGTLVMENDPDDNDDDDDSEDEDDDTDDGDDDDDSEDEDSEDEKNKLDPKDRRIQEVSAEAKKYRLRNRENRKKIADLEAKIAELGKSKTPAKKDGENPDEDLAVKQELEELRQFKTQNEGLARTNEDLLIRLEFMANNKYTWKNPKAALKLLDLSDVEIDEDGEIEGLDEAIEALAKSDSYLLDNGKKEKDEKQQRRRGATGQPTGSTRKGNPNREKLISKYPALRR